MDAAFEAVFHQLGDKAGMINMRVGEKHGMDLGGIAGKGTVIEARFRFGTLEHAAIDHHVSLFGFNHIRGSGDGSGSPVEVKLNAHLSPSVTCWNAG